MCQHLQLRHVTFRTTPVTDDLDLAAHGLRYLDVDPAALNLFWSGAAPWVQFHDVERTLDGLRQHYADQLDGYRRYFAAAGPAAQLVLAAAAQPPTAGAW